MLFVGSFMARQGDNSMRASQSAHNTFLAVETAHTKRTVTYLPEVTVVVPVPVPVVPVAGRSTSLILKLFLHGKKIATMRMGTVQPCTP